MGRGASPRSAEADACRVFVGIGKFDRASVRAGQFCRARTQRAVLRTSLVSDDEVAFSPTTIWQMLPSAIWQACCFLWGDRGLNEPISPFALWRLKVILQVEAAAWSFDAARLLR